MTGIGGRLVAWDFFSGPVTVQLLLNIMLNQYSAAGKMQATSLFSTMPEQLSTSINLVLSAPVWCRLPQGGHK